MVCKKCRRQHARFKNGKLKKTCPRGKRGSGIAEIIFYRNVGRKLKKFGKKLGI